MTVDAAFNAQPELHARLYPTAAGHPQAVYYVLVCRATLGALVRTATPAPGCVGLDTGAPVFPVNTRELAPIPGLSPPTHHHGLVFDPPRDATRFREFILFHGEYAYPEYLLAYHRR